jgi:hypothetical protein
VTKTFAGERGQEYTLKVVINAEFDFEGGEVIASKTAMCG